MSIKALVLRTAGTNCAAETAHALQMCSAKVDLLHLSRIISQPKKLRDYTILVIPGGFSYGDDVAAGKILANELKFKIGKELQLFVQEKKLVIGICNGFQVLVKTGLLPGSGLQNFVQTVTLTQNDSGRFQCEWVPLKKENSQAKWLKDLPSSFEFPIAHSEGKFVAKDSKILNDIEKNRQVVFRYHGENPNGSTNSIAGICNTFGNVVGLMPHPERFVTKFQHPAWTKNHLSDVTPGFLFWKFAVQYAKQQISR